MSYINAFWVGGLICALAQILLEKTKLMPGRIMVLIVCLGAVLSFFGIYEPFAEYAGAGANVPLLGFGNVLMKGVKDAVDEYGFLGIFMGGFKAGAVGCSGALILTFRYEQEHLTCLTGISLTTFSMDKSIETLWDQGIKKALANMQIGFEE